MLFDFLVLFVIIIIEMQMAADRRFALNNANYEIAVTLAGAAISVYWQNLFQDYNQWKRLLLYNLLWLKNQQHPFHPLLSCISELVPIYSRRVTVPPLEG